MSYLQRQYLSWSHREEWISTFFIWLLHQKSMTSYSITTYLSVLWLPFTHGPGLYWAFTLPAVISMSWSWFLQPFLFAFLLQLVFEGTHLWHGTSTTTFLSSVNNIIACKVLPIYGLAPLFPWMLQEKNMDLIRCHYLPPCLVAPPYSLSRSLLSPHSTCSHQYALIVVSSAISVCVPLVACLCRHGTSTITFFSSVNNITDCNVWPIYSLGPFFLWLLH